jgi:hypothetical protein
VLASLLAGAVGRAPDARPTAECVALSDEADGTGDGAGDGAGADTTEGESASGDA